MVAVVVRCGSVELCSMNIVISVVMMSVFVIEMICPLWRRWRKCWCGMRVRSG